MSAGTEATVLRLRDRSALGSWRMMVHHKMEHKTGDSYVLRRSHA